MSYEPIVLDQFNGWNFTDDLGSTAIDYSSSPVNVELSGGTIRNRKGFDNFTSSAAAAEYSQLFAHSDSILLARRTTAIAAINTSGAEATTGTITDAFASFARLGTPSASYTFIADGTLAVIQYDGSTFTAGAANATVDGVGSRAMPKGKHLAVTGASNRLVVAGTATSGGPNAATSSGSHVWFSDPGAPTTWDTDNFVQLQPGDGESIVGCVTWRGQVFVFKPSTLFIFYGETADSSGNPVFNWRSVSLGADAACFTPASANGNGTVTSGPEGVYYIGPNGVWQTTGDAPYSLSDAMLKRLRVTPVPDFYSGYWAGVDAGIYYHLGRLYIVTNPGSAVSAAIVTVIYDLATGNWMTWPTTRVKGYASWAAGTSETRLFSAARDLDSTGKHVMVWSNATTEYTTDNGVAITLDPAYTTQSSDLGIPDEKEIRQIEVWGSGSSVTVNIIADFGERTTTGTVALDTGSAEQLEPSKDFMRKSAWGTYFKIRVASATAYKIERIVIHLREARPTGTKSA